MVYITGSRRLGVQIDKPGPFAVDIDLQANLPTGSYMLEAAAMNLMTQKDIASATSVMLRVRDPGTFAGGVQLNGVMRVTS